jgi:hypothetical protein
MPLPCGDVTAALQAALKETIPNPLCRKQTRESVACIEPRNPNNPPAMPGFTNLEAEPTSENTL